jgi:hypothetical protein
MSLSSSCMAFKFFFGETEWQTWLTSWYYSQVRPNDRGHNKAFTCSPASLNSGPLWYRARPHLEPSTFGHLARHLSELFFHLSTVVLPVGFSKLTDPLKYIWRWCEVHRCHFVTKADLFMTKLRLKPDHGTKLTALYLSLLNASPWAWLKLAVGLKSCSEGLLWTLLCKVMDWTET